MQVLLPGDSVSVPSNLQLGPGLRRSDSLSAVTDQQQVVATLPGTLILTLKHAYIRHNRKRYLPQAQDRVIGVVIDRMGTDSGGGGDLYRLEIGATNYAVLNNLSFEGASKRNKPQFQPGQVLYLRVSELFDGYLDPELSCVLGPHDAGVPRKEWLTNEGTYGELKGGTLTKISIGLARQLLLPNNLVLAELSKNKFPFEVAIGVNGYLWMHSQKPDYIILIQNAITNSEVLTPEQIRAMVKSLVYTVEKQIQKDQDAMDED
ncbi:hypothetical protein MPSEU_000778500 [Mayamaea pseudoterrestris]|nr:hypothetical protein MPSEU_000778500 [Mayamaea pseudoterrestris]